MKRVLLLIGGIMGTLLSIVDLVMTAITVGFMNTIISAIPVESRDIVTTILGVSFLIAIPLLILLLVFNIKSISLFAKSQEEYFAKMKSVICAIIFNFICAIICIPVDIPGLPVTFWDYIIFFAFIVAAVLQLIHICIEKKPQDFIQASAGHIVSKAPMRPVVYRDEISMDNFQDYISKLYALKESGALTEEEFQTAKTKYLEKLNK